jgi:hypothetical protein
MNIYGILISFITLLIVVISAINHWFLSKGNLSVSYKLIVIIYLLCIILDSCLGFFDINLRGLLLFLPTHFWAILMALKGLKRINFK